jgi:ferric-dicitrate binding protein FerR (iron transport regulator)
MKDDYLWDRSGEPDLEVVRLEGALRSARYDEAADLPAQVKASPRPRRARRWLGPTIALVPIAAAAAALPLLWHNDAPVAPSTSVAGLTVKLLAGAPVIDRTALADGGRLLPGQWLTTDGGSRALIEMSIGEVRVGPDSRVRLVGAGPAQQRLELGRGALHARVNAPPRLFLVDLPSATAVDLGCEYELVVDDSGAGVLRVATGEVSLEGHGRASLVPAGSSCETRPGHGPGTPYRGDAPERLIDALRRLDFEGGGGRALDAALASARASDTLTLWHLIERSTGRDRAAVVTRLAALAPPPPGVRIGDPAAPDPAALASWRAELESTW